MRLSTGHRDNAAFANVTPNYSLCYTHFINPVFDKAIKQLPFLFKVPNLPTLLTIQTSCMQNVRLYMLLLGSTPKGRHIEQHDIYFGIAENLKSLVPGIVASWPEAEGKIHIDAWREVTAVDGFTITVKEKNTDAAEVKPGENNSPKLFFINMGGYKQNEFEEYHYKMLTVAKDKGAAIQQAKQTAFYKHTGFKTAESHIDDKYGVDVDDIYAIEDILPDALKQQYTLIISPNAEAVADEIHLGYFKLEKL